MPTGLCAGRRACWSPMLPMSSTSKTPNGDGKADIRQVVLTGFAFTNPQHMVNNPVYGLDNWIYLAHEGPAAAVIFTDKFGDRGSDLRFPDRPDAPLAETGAPHASLPARYARTGISGEQQPVRPQLRCLGPPVYRQQRGPYSRGSDRRRRIWSAIPTCRSAAAMARISDHRPAADVYPITAPCARRDVERRRFLHVGLRHHGLSRRRLSRVAGPLFADRRAGPEPGASRRPVAFRRRLRGAAGRVEGVEFLASTDAWFRPVNLYIGPGRRHLPSRLLPPGHRASRMDGHPDASLRPDLYKGDDRGRIYRIVSGSAARAPGQTPTGQGLRPGTGEAPRQPEYLVARTAQRLARGPSKRGVGRASGQAV